jgi:hypothetical protein
MTKPNRINNTVTTSRAWINPAKVMELTTPSSQSASNNAAINQVISCFQDNATDHRTCSDAALSGLDLFLSACKSPDRVSGDPLDSYQ